MTSFEDLGLCDELLRAIREGGYHQPTPIQAKAIPVVLSGTDIMASAQTGTGKTAGFTLPILHNLSRNAAAGGRSRGPKVRALILTPTRELAAQISENVVHFGKYLPLKSAVVFGGVSINPQISKLRKGVDVLIATPGRLLDHASQGTIDTSELEVLVLDEADRMLDMGFIHDVRRVFKLVPDKTQRQSLLFSATFSKEIRQLAQSMLNRPESVDVAPPNATADRILQQVYLVEQKQKRPLLSYLIKENDWQQVLVFTKTKHRANRLAEQLERDGHVAAAIHGNKSQGARTRALSGFKSGAVKVLVATDIAARGIDIDQLPHVVNYELPNVAEDYVHRIGRTARAGQSGEAISLVSSDEKKLLASIERLIKQSITRARADGFIPQEDSASKSPSATPKPRQNRKPVQRKARPTTNRTSRRQSNGTSGVAR